MMSRLIQNLKESEKVTVLDYIMSRRGLISLQEVAFRNDSWFLREVNCRKSSYLDLGDCPCENHKARTYTKITEDEAIRLLTGHYDGKRLFLR